MPTDSIQLGVNIDHVATLRQARRGVEPDPSHAAHEAELAGADIITVHLREDRRHIQDDDVDRLRRHVRTKLNLEMAATHEMLCIARHHEVPMCTLVPEGRHEITTEGGLDVASQVARLRDFVAALRDAGIFTSAFIDADERQIDAAASVGFQACEIHTGPFSRAFRSDVVRDELEKVRRAGARIIGAGMRFHAGHALNYKNVERIAALPGLRELHIGHSIISRAVFTGLPEAVREMKRLIEQGRAEGQARAAQ